MQAGRIAKGGLEILTTISSTSGVRASIREGFKKSKWKFKMAFAMKGGGSRGGLECHIPILKNDFC